MEKLTPFNSLTCLCISDSEFCRNWKKEAIRGRIFLGCCRTVSMFRTFQLSLDLCFELLNHLVSRSGPPVDLLTKMGGT